MTEEHLYINSVEIELPQNAVSHTLQVNDIADIQDRNADYSNNIKIPKTATNIQTFEMLGLTGTTTRMPYQTISIKYIVDGIELITSGKGVIKNTNKYYNLVIYDGNISMSELIGDARMNELDFTSYNHSLTQTIFTDSFTNTEGYIYALGEFFLDSTFDNIVSIDLTSPSFFMHTLFSNIFTEKGYTISGSILTDSDFKSRLISMNNGYDRFTTESRTLRNTLLVSTQVFEEYLTVPTIERFETSTYTSVKSVRHTLNFNGSIHVESGSNPVLILNVDGNDITTQALPYNPFDPITFDVDVDIQLQVGSILTIYVQLESHNEDFEGTALSEQTIDADIDWTRKIYENDVSIVIDFALLIGDMKQIDFVKDIMQRFGMMFRKTKNDLNFEFTTMSTVLTDKSGVEDWTGKYDAFLDEKYKPSYAQTNQLKYKYNDDPDSNTELTYADGDILVNNVNLDFTKTLFTSVFKASTFTNSGYWTLNHWITKEDEIIINEDGLGIFKQIDSGGSFQFRFNNAEDGSTVYTGTFPLLNFDSIFYQKEIDNNYSEFQSLLSDFRFITLGLNLSVIDIYEMDFFKLKYFEQLGQYYYLNKIIGFKNSKVTKAEFIQIGADIVGALTLTGTTTGESVASSTLSKVSEGQMISHITSGCTSLSTITSADAGLTAFDTSTAGATVFLACSRTLDIVRYHDGIGSEPANADLIYEDSGGGTLFDGGGLYYKSDTNRFAVSSVGVVSSVTAC